MRNWSFGFKTEESYAEAANALMEIFKNSEDFKNRKIVLCGITDKDGSKKIFLSIEDNVPGSFVISTSNAYGKHLANGFLAIKPDCRDDINLKLPIDVTINSWWEEDPKPKVVESTEDGKGN
jgi:hypothetical protein